MKKLIKSLYISLLLLLISPLQASFNVCYCSKATNQVVPFVPLKTKEKIKEINRAGCLQGLRNSIVIENENMLNQEQYFDLEFKVVRQAVKLKIIDESYDCYHILPDYIELKKLYARYKEKNSLFETKIT